MSERELQPFRLAAEFVERVWGRRDLSPWYRRTSQNPVGEAWLTGERCIVETGPHARTTLGDLMGNDLPLLVKMLFPAAKLSVQVHPDDEQAALLGGNARAKTECWYVLDAEPGAAVSLGMKRGTSKEEMLGALGSAALEELMQPVEVRAGDMLYVQAGTVHGIGPGMVVLEVQQVSDTTYRLYDYGRARELHLEEGRKVIKLDTASGKVAPRQIGAATRLIEGKHFIVDRYEVRADAAVELPESEAVQCVIALKGKSRVVWGDSSVEAICGQAVVVPGGCRRARVEGDGVFVRCSA